MNKLGKILEIGFLVSLFVYLYLVAIKGILGETFLSFNDGIILIISIVLGVIWFVIPVQSPFDTDAHKESMDIGIYGVIGLQILLLLQIGSGQGVVKFWLLFLALGIYSLGVVVFIAKNTLGEKYLRYLSFVSNRRLQYLYRYVVMFGLGLLTVMPWVFWILAQMGMGLNYISAGIIIVFTGIVVLRVYNVYSSQGRNDVRDSLIIKIPNFIKISLHRLSLLILIFILAGLGYYGYASRKSINPEYMSNITLLDSSNDWLQDKSGIFRTEAAFYSNQFLEFKINIEDDGEYSPTFMAGLSDLGAQVEVEVVDRSNDTVLSKQKLDPFQCEFWLNEDRYKDIFSDSVCPQIDVSVELDGINLSSGGDYVIRIVVLDDFPTKFNDELQVKYGGYISLKDFKLINEES
ncbi:MAG: hypothetical protein ACO3TG_03465 [Minisyncoccia bacterium]